MSLYSSIKKVSNSVKELMYPEFQYHLHEERDLGNGVNFKYSLWETHGSIMSFLYEVRVFCLNKIMNQNEN